MRKNRFKNNPFFSLSKEIREEYEKKNISVINIKVITEYMKNNLGHYFKNIKKNNADLSDLLKEIKEEKKVIIMSPW